MRPGRRAPAAPCRQRRGRPRPADGRRRAGRGLLARAPSGRCSSPAAARGSRRARPDLEQLAERCGALLATSAAAKGLFRGSPWDLDVSGGFASPLAAELIGGADLVVGWGCSLNMWTTAARRADRRRARRSSRSTSTPGAIGAHRPVHLGVRRRRRGDGRAAGRPAALARPRTDAGAGYRSPSCAERIGREVRWRDVPYDGRERRAPDRPAHAVASRSTTCCPPSGWSRSTRATSWATRACTCRVPDADGLLLHPGLPVGRSRPGSAIGAAIARPDRLTVAALGDGGALMGISELETVVRLGLPHGDRGLRRRGLRRRGPPLRPGRAPAGHGPVPAGGPRRDRRAASAATASPCAAAADLAAGAGLAGRRRGTGRWSSTPR